MEFPSLKKFIKNIRQHSYSSQTKHSDSRPNIYSLNEQIQETLYFVTTLALNIILDFVIVLFSYYIVQLQNNHVENTLNTLNTLLTLTIKKCML